MIQRIHVLSTAWMPSKYYEWYSACMIVNNIMAWLTSFITRQYVAPQTKWRLLITKTRLFKYIVFFPPKTENFQIKNSDVFHISAKNIDCGTRYNRLGEMVLTSTHNLCFWAEIRKNNVYSCKPQFYHIKVGLKGVCGLAHRGPVYRFVVFWVQIAIYTLLCFIIMSVIMCGALLC